MNTAIIDRWAIAMKTTLPWYMGYLDQRNEPGERLYCRTLAVVMQDRVMAGQDALQLPIRVPAGVQVEFMGLFA